MVRRQRADREAAMRVTIGRHRYDVNRDGPMVDVREIARFRGTSEVVTANRLRVTVGTWHELRCAVDRVCSEGRPSPNDANGGD